MIDYAKITIKAGDGGDGCGSFQRIKGKRYGRADGGGGGRGGDVYCQATRDLSSLDTFRYVKDYKAQKGKPGSSNLRKGVDSEDLVLKVPVGTQVKVYGSLSTTATHFDFDLIEDRQKILVARGGEGGRGNAKLRDEFARRPRTGERGEAGEFKKIILELKLIADIGLIGLPNAGKSTLLAALSAARPAIAPYPFTTLEPNLGVLTFSGPVTSFPPASAPRPFSVSDDDSVSLSTSEKARVRAVRSPSTGATRKSSLVIADIPGLIEGASAGKGLGDLFLRHIERTKMLVHLVDVSQVSQVKESLFSTSGKANVPKESKGSLWHDYQVVRKELAQYSKELLLKKEIIVLTKVDLVSGEKLAAAVQEFAKHRKKVWAISVKTGVGLAELVETFYKKLK